MCIYMYICIIYIYMHIDIYIMYRHISYVIYVLLEAMPKWAPAWRGCTYLDLLGCCSPLQLAPKPQALRPQPSMEAQTPRQVKLLSKHPLLKNWALVLLGLTGSLKSSLQG